MGDAGNFDDHINTVKERAGDAFIIDEDLLLGASAFFGGIAKVATRAGVLSRNKHKVGGEGALAAATRDMDLFVF